MAHPHQEVEKTTYLSILSSAILAIIKFLGGLLGNSYALIADAIESVADIFASILVLLGIKYAKRPADENHPYGHGRIEPLVTFLVVGFLLISAVLIFVQSIQNIQTPHASPKPWTLALLGGIILWKELSFRYVMRKAKKVNSTSLKADAWHHRSDAITSVAAFIGILISVLAGPGFETADDWAAIFAALFIVYNCYLIFRPALGEIMDEQNYDELITEIRAIALTVPGVKGTEKCFVRKVGIHYQVDLHATVDGTLTVRQGHDIAHLLKDTLMANIMNLQNVLIHVEPYCSHAHEME